MGSHKGVLRLAHKDYYPEALRLQVLNAYGGTLDPIVLARMDVDALRLLLEHCPKEENTASSSVVVWEYNFEEAQREAHEKHFAPDGRPNPHRRGVRSQGWGF